MAEVDADDDVVSPRVRPRMQKQMTSDSAMSTGSAGGTFLSVPMASAYSVNSVNMLSDAELGEDGRQLIYSSFMGDPSTKGQFDQFQMEKNPLCQYLSESSMRTEKLGERLRRYLQRFYGVPREQGFNLRQLQIFGTTDAKFMDIVRNLMNVRCADARDLDDVSTMLRDTRLQWSFFDIVESDVPRSLYWVLCHFSILGQIIANSKALLAFYSTWYCSLIVAYDPVLQYDPDLYPGSSTYKRLQRLDLGFDILFFFTTLSELRTTFIDPSRFVERCEPRAIWWQTVLSLGFWMDLTSCLPTAFVYFMDAPLLMLLVKILFRMRCTLAWLCDIHNSARLQMQAYWQQILRLMLLIVLLGHTVGCFWYTVCNPQDHPDLAAAGGGQKWIFPWNADRPLFLYYAYFSKTGLYLALGIIVQGYSITENALIAILAPLGSVGNALILSTIIVLMSRKTALETNTLVQVANLKQAISTQGLPPTIQLRLMAYHTQKRVHRCRSETENIFRGISGQLRFELNLVLYCNLLIEADIFKKSHPRVIRLIVLVFEDKLFLPGDYVCRYDDEGSEMYFIFKGMLDVFSPGYALLCSMKKGQHFGEVALLTGQRRTAYVQAKMFCMLASLSKTNFDAIMREYPQQYDVIMQQMSAKRRQWMQSLVKQQKMGKDAGGILKSTVKRAGSSGVAGGKNRKLGRAGSGSSCSDDEEAIAEEIAKVEKTEEGGQVSLKKKASICATVTEITPEKPKTRRRPSQVSVNSNRGRKLSKDKSSGSKERSGSKESCGSKGSEESSSSKGSKGRKGSKDSKRNSGQVTMVIPFVGSGDEQSENSKGTDSDDDSDSDSTDSKSKSGSDSDEDAIEDTSESAGGEDGDDDEEDIEALVDAVSKHCSMALHGNERIFARLKEINQRQDRTVENAQRMCAAFGGFSLNIEDRNTILEYLCEDVAEIQKAIKECSDLGRGETDTAWSHLAMVDLEDIRVLEVGMLVSVKKDFQSDGPGQMPLQTGLHGAVKRIDPSGDALIAFDGIEQPRWVFTENFSNLQKDHATERRDSTADGEDSSEHEHSPRRNSVYGESSTDSSDAEGMSDVERTVL